MLVTSKNYDTNANSRPSFKSVEIIRKSARKGFSIIVKDDKFEPVVKFADKSEKIYIDGVSKYAKNATKAVSESFKVIKNNGKHFDLLECMWHTQEALVKLIDEIAPQITEKSKKSLSDPLSNAQQILKDIIRLGSSNYSKEEKTLIIK